MSDTPNVELIFESFLAFLKSGLIKTAIEFEVFTRIAAGTNTADTLADAAGADRRAMRIVLDALVAQEFLTKSGASYGLTPTAQMFLVKGGPTYLGDFTRITINPRLWQAVGQLSTVLRSGKPAEAMIEVPNHEFWVEFSQASAQTSVLPAMMLADVLSLDAAAPLEILDIACGSGLYGFTVLERCPAAHLTSLDWPAVLDQSRKIAESRGVADRVTWLPGSAFDAPLPDARFDIVIASHFYHHFAPAENTALSKRLLSCLKPGGRLVVHDWVADDARAAHPQALTFAVVMLVSTPHGDVYTLPEYRSMLESAGFADLELHSIPVIGSSALVARRPA